MLVSHRDDLDGMKEHLFRITKKGTKAIEVVVSGDRKGEYAYLGTFMPMSRWLPFKKEITGDIPELVSSRAVVRRSRLILPPV